MEWRFNMQEVRWQRAPCADDSAQLFNVGDVLRGCLEGDAAHVAMTLVWFNSQCREFDIFGNSVFDAVRDGMLLACQRDYVDVVRALLDVDGVLAVDVHYRDDFYFAEACNAGSARVVRELLSLRGGREIPVARDNYACFRRACRFRHVAVVREFLALPLHRRPLPELQALHAAVCGDALRAWTHTVHDCRHKLPWNGLHPAVHHELARDVRATLHAARRWCVAYKRRGAA